MASFFAGIILVVVGLLYNYGKKIQRQKRAEAFKQNVIAGYIEYFLAWNIFHHELLPEVYYWAIDNQHNSEIGIYDEAFDDIGYKLYGNPPADEAVVRAKKIMVANGRTPYNGHWEWDDHKGCLTRSAQEVASMPLEKRGREVVMRVDIQGWKNANNSGYEAEITSDPLYTPPQGHPRWIDWYKKAGTSRWIKKVIYEPFDDFYRWPARNKAFAQKQLKNPVTEEGRFVINDIGIFPPPRPEPPPPPPDPNKQVIINERNYDILKEDDDYIYDWYRNN